MELLQPVTELLNGQYAAVGIMEEWKASIRLFQAALDLPNFDWAKVGGRPQHHSGFTREQHSEFGPFCPMLLRSRHTIRRRSMFSTHWGRLGGGEARSTGQACVV